MKTVVISGASRGIGRALALTFAQHNYRVALLARSQHDLAQLASEIATETLCYAIDIGNEQDIDKAIHDILATWQHIDVLINNAGIGIFKPTEHITDEEWDSVMTTNVKGTFLLTKAVLPSMKARKSGMVIGVASDVSKRVFANGALYCASKYAQDAFLSALRKEVRQDNIRVSVIYPGLVDTYFHQQHEGDDTQKEFLKAQDIANAALYIAESPAYVVIDELMLHPISQEY